MVGRLPVSKQRLGETKAAAQARITQQRPKSLARDQHKPETSVQHLKACIKNEGPVLETQ